MGNTQFTTLFQAEKFIQIGDSTMKVREDDLRKVVIGGCVYPKAKSMREKEIKQCPFIVEYECNEESCKFADAIKKISNKADLNRLGVRSTTELIVQQIERDQTLFTARDVGGFVFQSTGNPYLFLKNKDVSIENDETILGFFDLTEIRRHAIYSRLERETASESWKQTFTLSAAVFLATLLAKRL